jgi:death-on-curing protein
VIEPFWVPVEFAIGTNKRTVAATGESFLVLNHGLLESALYRPKHSFAYGETDIVKLATLLLSGIARNHSFQQGNKRTGLHCAIQFLEGNGYGYTCENTERIGRRVKALVRHWRTEDWFAEHIRPFIEPISEA